MKSNMVRELRIEYAGALYHITSRGDGQEYIYISEEDRILFLAVFSEVCRRCNWSCYAYCLMSNHYHLLVETPNGNLSKGMQLLNGIYTQRFNRLHKRVGHVFQGRYKAILVEKDSYLLELTRYVVLNPVRAKMVPTVSDWFWSSYQATINEAPRPSWLLSHAVLSLFSQNTHEAIKQYQNFVNEGTMRDSPWISLKNQIYLGSDSFVTSMQNKIDPGKKLIDIPKEQYTANAPTLNEYEKKYNNRNECIALAYASGQYSLAEIGTYFGLHYSRISRIIKWQTGSI